MIQKPKLPGWLDLVLQELMKPPIFLDKTVKGEHNPTETKKEDEKKSNFTEKRQSSASEPVLQEASRRLKTSQHEVSSSRNKTDEIKRINHVTPINNTVQTYLANQYGWKMDRVSTFDNITRIDTDHGAFAVKETHITPRHVEFLHQVLSFAKDNGFNKFSPITLTKTKKAFIRHDDKTIYATSWLEGVTVNFASLEHIGQTAYSLAEFHEATKGFQTKGYKPQMVYDLSRITEERNRDLRQMIQIAEAKTEPDEFDKTLMELKPNLQDDAAESLQLLESNECESFISADRSNPGICHLDVIPSNFIYAPNHHVYILDLDLAAFAPRAMDISHLLRRSMQQLNWHPDTAYTCFLHYNAISPMPKAEYDIVYALLRFPYMAWRLAHTHYRFFAEDDQIGELKFYQNQEPKRQAFLAEFTKQIANLGVST